MSKIKLDFFASKPKFKQLFSKLSLKEKMVLEKLILLGEGEHLFAGFENNSMPLKSLKKMADSFLEIDQFYQGIGGIEGYFQTFLKLLKAAKTKKAQIKAKVLEPGLIDISKKNAQVEKYIQAGLKSLPLIAALFPIGGSGDRLNLTDSEGRPLPVACLPFLGKTLLEGMIKDLEALEYLYFKTFQKKVLIPIVLMTSNAKDNHAHILNLLKTNNYFQRPKSSFCLFKQSSVPVISEKGHFTLKGPLELMVKPGGHGVVWKLMEEKKVFEWLLKQKRKKLLIRQINNPVSGLDYGLLAFLGYGCLENKAFGFAACPRAINAAEGTDILKHVPPDKYNVSNVEYTDFALWGIHDKPLKKGSPYSKYPANTNLLFADLEALQKAAKKDPYPGIIINLKTKVKDSLSKKELKGGRLELMMQNIADVLFDRLKKPITEKGKLQLQTFLTYNERIKTISPTKKAYIPGQPLLETPEGAFFDYLKNMELLFRTVLGFQLPSLGMETDYLKKGPSFSIILNPALGPLFSEIAKKISLGRIFPGSELVLDLSEVFLENLSLNGSCIIEGPSLQNCFATLKNVKIENGGIDRRKKNCFWKRQLFHKGQFILKLNENSQFFAKDICFRGSFKIEVLKNQKVTAFFKKGKVVFKKERLNKEK